MKLALLLTLGVSAIAAEPDALHKLAIAQRDYAIVRAQSTEAYLENQQKTDAAAKAVEVAHKAAEKLCSDQKLTLSSATASCVAAPEKKAAK